MRRNPTQLSAHDVMANGQKYTIESYKKLKYVVTMNTWRALNTFPNRTKLTKLKKIAIRGTIFNDISKPLTRSTPRTPNSSALEDEWMNED